MNHHRNTFFIVLTLSIFSNFAYAQYWEMPPESERCPAVWGKDDQRGAANMITSESTLAAFKLVKTGEIFELGDVLSNDPEESYINRGRQFNIYTKPSIPIPDTRVASEELIITELGQIGTQLDAFSHQMYGDSFYNCFKFDDIATRSGYHKLGVENVGTIISRGVLIDIAGLKGVEILAQNYVITAEDLQQALARQNVKLQQGDTVLINTGWGKHRGSNNKLYGSDSPGLGIAAGLWLVSQKPILIGADNCCVEFRSAAQHSLPVHSLTLIQHGIYLVENMVLDALAAARAYEFVYVMQPLKLKGATGSAVAPVAIR